MTDDLRSPLPAYPPYAAGERATLDGFLDWYRSVVTRKLEGIDEAAARAHRTPTGMSAMGVVRHLAAVELWWFVEVITGRWPRYVFTTEEHAADPDIDWKPAAHETVASVLEYYRIACDDARATVAALDLDRVFPVPNQDRAVSLRWIYVHMIEESARHAGHLDLMREQIDGMLDD